MSPLISAARGLLRARQFTLMVLVILAIDIGATTAIFPAVNEEMLRPLGFRDPKRLVMHWESGAGRCYATVQPAIRAARSDAMAVMNAA